MTYPAGAVRVMVWAFVSLVLRLKQLPYEAFTKSDPSVTSVVVMVSPATPDAAFVVKVWFEFDNAPYLVGRLLKSAMVTVTLALMPKTLSTVHRSRNSLFMIFIFFLVYSATKIINF